MLESNATTLKFCTSVRSSSKRFSVCPREVCQGVGLTSDHMTQIASLRADKPRWKVRNDLSMIGKMLSFSMHQPRLIREQSTGSTSHFGAGKHRADRGDSLRVHAEGCNLRISWHSFSLGYLKRDTCLLKLHCPSWSLDQ